VLDIFFGIENPKKLIGLFFGQHLRFDQTAATEQLSRKTHNTGDL
jgi:hypothetical protein